MGLAVPGVRQVNFLWGYATLGEPMDGACLAALVAQAQSQLPRFKEQNLSNMAWALATMGAHEPVGGSNSQSLHFDLLPRWQHNSVRHSFTAITNLAPYVLSFPSSARTCWCDCNFTIMRPLEPGAGARFPKGQPEV